MYFSRARYYHPGLARFLNEDPIGMVSGDINAYVYVRNNPLRWTDALGLRIEWGNIVVNNPNVIANLYRLNQAIIDQGKSNNDFTLKITGGDRFIDSQGNFVSLTDFSVIPPTETNRRSEHLIENGARGVDLTFSGINRGQFNSALRNTDFLRANTKVYSDHTHIGLPNLPKFKIDPDSLPPDLSGRKDLFGP